MRLRSLTAVAAVLVFGGLAAAENPGITVSGSGRVSVAPNCAHITAGATAFDADPANAYNTVNTKMDAVIKAVAAQGIDKKDYGTVGFSLQPVYRRNQQGDDATLSGYSGSNQLSITVRNLDNVGKVIDAVAKAGANSFSNISFEADRGEAGIDALKMAMADAKSKAEAAAKEAGVQLGDPVSITESVRTYGMEAAYARMSDAPAGVGRAAIATGSKTVAATVTVTYSIIPKAAFPGQGIVPKIGGTAPKPDFPSPARP